MEVYFVMCVFILFPFVEASLFQKFRFDSTIESKTCQPADLHETSTQDDDMRCAHKCSRHESCKSFFFSDETNICNECEAIYILSTDAAESTSTSRYFFKQQNNNNISDNNNGITTTTEQAQSQYVDVGCFSTTSASTYTTLADNSKATCGEYCSQHGMTSEGFGMEDTTCECLDQTEFLAVITSGNPLTTCTTPCPGQASEMCGNVDQAVSNYYSYPGPLGDFMNP